MKSSLVAVQVNKAHYPVTVLGPGRRIGLWLQGCSIGCKGCVSMDTWAADPRKSIPVGMLVDWCRSVAAGGLDGITISGGEPFDQPSGLTALLAELREWRRSAGLDFDILCYSGYPLKTLRRRHARALALLDALIPEPYVDRLEQDSPWRGSSNQPIVTLSKLGQQRYAAYENAGIEDSDKKFQVAVESGKVWMIGIPARGDMNKVEELCKSRGLSLEGVSWRR